MTTLPAVVKNPTEIVLQTGLLLSSLTPEIQVPEPSLEWKQKIEALQEAGLEKKLAAAIFGMRVEQAETLGFHKLGSETEAVKFLMGSAHTDLEEEKERKNYDWAYFHHTGTLKLKDKCDWGSKYNQYIRKEKTNPWFLPPFSKVEAWRVLQHPVLDSVKKAIPHDVILAINLLKKLKLFNAFKAFEASTGCTMVVGQVWELPPDDKGERNTSGENCLFLIAKF